MISLEAFCEALSSWFDAPIEPNTQVFIDLGIAGDDFDELVLRIQKNMNLEPRRDADVRGRIPSEPNITTPFIGLIALFAGMGASPFLLKQPLPYAVADLYGQLQPAGRARASTQRDKGATSPAAGSQHAQARMLLLGRGGVRRRSLIRRGQLAILGVGRVGRGCFQGGDRFDAVEAIGGYRLLKRLGVG
jgi:hypothetical protein